MNTSVITQTVAYIRTKLEGEGSGHDWWHIYRVWSLAKRIAKSKSQANSEIVELAALLHDVADWKFHGGDESVGPQVAGEFLTSLKVDPMTILAVQEIIQDVSYKGAGVTTKPRSLEGMIVQDADRLDALGAIGIARCFVYSGHVNRPMWDPVNKPVLHQTAKEYKDNKGSAINHFYEKLLLLKDRLHTHAAKQMAIKRHAYMEQFLTKFYAEWDGKE
jgi:uncharacterized protein